MRFATLLVACLASAPLARASDEIEDSFDFEEPAEEPADAPVSTAPGALSAGSTLRSDWHLWTERSDTPLAKARQTIDPWVRYQRDWLLVRLGARAEYDAAYLVDRDRYDDATLDAYEWLVDIRETYVAASGANARAVVGRQIANWGQADLSSILDLTNPRDYREPGLADLEDIRVPTLATLLEYARGAHRVQAFFVHEARFGFRSPPLGPFGLLLAVDDIEALVEDRILRWNDSPERFTLSGQQAVGRWQLAAHGIDLSVVVASILDRPGVFAVPTSLAGDDIEVPIDHPRYHVIGTSGALPLSSWILRWEASAELERSVNTHPTTVTLDVARATLLRALGAVSYSGIDDLTLAVELSAGRFLDEPDDLLFPVQAPVLAARAQWLAWHGDLELLGIAYVNGIEAELGWITRTQASYRLRDGLRATVGFAHFHPGSELSPLAGFGTHDRAFAQLRWDFVVE